MLRQKPDAHGYGPLALLPKAPGGDDVVEDISDPPMRTTSLAIVIPPRSVLQHALRETVWPVWEALFAELGIPCDSLDAPADEFTAGLEQLRHEL